MSQRNPDDAIRAWFADGPTRGPNDGLERTLSRLAAERQGRQLRLSLWLPIAALLVLTLVALAAFGAGFRIVAPGPLPTPTQTAGRCRLDIPVLGKNALLLGTGFPPAADVTLQIDRADGSSITITTSEAAELHTDREGSFAIQLRPYPEDLGRDVITATAGCVAVVDAVTAQQDLPPACPDPAARAATTIDGTRYRAAVAADAPLAWWHLDDIDTTARDAAGSAPATYRGTFTHASLSALSDGGSVFLNWRPGQDPTSVALDRQIVLQGDFTIEAWTYLCHYLDDGDVVLGSTDSPIQLFFDDGILSLSDAVVEPVRATTPVAANRWQAWVVTRQAGRLRIYLDGRLDAEGDTWEGDVRVGLLGLNGAGNNLLGFLDEVALYDHALAPERIAGHAAP
jgi:Concanavalin A-like lectin/glucanases superfamily